MDVAKRAGVSIATVSRVLTQSPHKVTRPSRTRIHEAVKELDYRPNALAQGLIMKRSMTIGTIIPDISNPYYAEIVRGIQDVAEDLGYAVVLQNTDRSKEQDHQEHSRSSGKRGRMESSSAGGSFTPMRSLPP